MHFIAWQNLWPIAIVLLAAVLAAASMLRWSSPIRREIDVQGGRLQSLDGLRGILCIGVLLHHAAITQAMVRAGGGWPTAESPTFHLLGRAAVALFFCITGFLFWGRAIDRGIRLNWLDFFRGRVFRIVPLYILMAALAATLLLTDRNADAISTARLAAFFGEVFSFGFREWSSIDVGTRAIRTESFDAGVHWTLRYEWMFYFALPVLAVLGKKRGVLLPIAVALWMAIAAATNLDLPISLMFAIGMAAAHAARSRVGLAMLTTRWAGMVALVAGVMLLAFASPPPWMLRLGTTANMTSPLSYVLTALIFFPVAAGNSLIGLLSVRPLRLLGAASYSVYLLHGIILYVARPWILPLVAPAPVANVGYWLAIAGLAAVITWLSIVTYSFIEQPFIAWDKRLRKGRVQNLTEHEAGVR